MKEKIFSVVSWVAVSFSIMTGMAYAHGTEKHDKGMLEDAQMKKLHAMMPMFSASLAQMESAIELGKKDVVEVEGSKIISAIPDLKKSKPHKNIKQRKKFVELASNLESSVKATFEHVRKGDYPGAKAALKSVEEVCAACHAKFKD